MKKSTKGALAGAAAALLLMGGLGTNAAWQADDGIDGGQIKTGALSLDGLTCGDWLFDFIDGGASKTVADPSSVLLVPGDILKKSCTFTVHVSGDHMSAKLAVTTPTIDNLKSAGQKITDLQAGVKFSTGGTAVPAGATVTDGQVVNAVLSVTVPKTLTGLTGQDLSGELDDVTVTLAQS